MPGRDIVYFDTSALAKWYLNESFSADVERYLMEHGPVAISDLTVVEMRSLLARRRREKHVDPKLENRIFSISASPCPGRGGAQRPGCRKRPRLICSRSPESRMA